MKRTIAIIGAVLAGLLTACEKSGDAGCTKDSDCKGDRVCVSGACVAPESAKGAPPAPASAAESAAAPAAADKPLVQTGARAVPQQIPQQQVLVEEEFAVNSSGTQVRTFTLAASRRIELKVEGVKDAAKGFMVYVMKSEEVPKFTQKQAFRSVPGFDGVKVRSFAHTEALPAGSWSAVIQNSENILKTMIVRVKVVADPRE
jgi:hypothetical protein